MEIENHKEEVPFEHYEELFRKADAREMAQRSGAMWDGKEFFVTLLGKTYAISHPKYGIREVDPHISHGEAVTASPQGEAFCSLPLPVQTFLLRFLLESKAAQWGGSWKTFREMPWGELYIKPYTGRVLTRAAFTFGTRLESFKAACEKMGATKVSHGDAGYQLELLPGYPMQILVWEGDEEFPPSAQVLYADSFETAFAPEDRVVAGDILITMVKANM